MAQIELQNLQAIGTSSISQVISTSYHPEMLLEPTLFYLASTTAVKYGLNPQRFTDTLYCESGLKIDAIGDHNTSFGISQIHLTAHPDITKAQALDPVWSLEFAANEFAKGNAREWSCYNKLYGKNRVE